MQKTVLLGLCLIILAACKTTNIAVYRGKDLSKYMQTPHFRAFAVAKGRSGGYVSYRAVGRPSVEIAMEDAIKGCKRYFALYLTIHPDCRVIFIGDTDIENMPQAEVDAVILAYKQEQETINSNLAELSDKIVCDTALQKNRLRWEANADSSAYVQQAVKRSLTPQHCAALMGRPTASLTNTAANKNSKSSPVAVNWAGYDKWIYHKNDYISDAIKRVLIIGFTIVLIFRLKKRRIIKNFFTQKKS